MNSAIETSSPRISERRVVQGGLVVGASILAGQALGYIRHATAAYLLGTGPAADAIAVALSPVDLWWAVASTAIVFGYGPLLAGQSEPRPSFRDLARPVTALALLAALLLLFFAAPVVGALAPGLPAGTAALAARLLRVSALAVPAVSLSTLLTALLYAERRFAFAAFHQGTVNIVTIAAAILLFPRLGVASFAAGYVAGAWLQLAAAFSTALPILRARRGSAVRATRGDLLRPLAVLSYSMLIGLNPVATRALASTFGSGSTAAFDYCLKLVGVPLALLVNPLSSSLLSELARFGGRRDRNIAIGAVGRAAATTALLSAAVVAVVMAAAPAVVAILFERGQFTAASTVTVTALLEGFYPVLAAWSVLDVISRSMLSLGKWRSPILCAALALAVNAAFSASGVVRSVRWIGLPAVVGLGCGAVLAAALRWRSRDPLGDGAAAA
jgi:putative peptidoglycan lipid II flippase